MDIPKEVLDNIIEFTNKNFEQYEREQYLSDGELIDVTNELYDNEKKVIVLQNQYEIKEKVLKSEKPWVYHTSLNMNWVLFFTSSYRKLYPYLDKEEITETKPIIKKVRLLRKVFDHVDGIVEDGDFVYLIKDDVNLIQTGLKKFTLN
jgi:hypothetical protein